MRVKLDPSLQGSLEAVVVSTLLCGAEVRPFTADEETTVPGLQQNRVGGCVERDGHHTQREIHVQRLCGMVWHQNG